MATEKQIEANRLNALKSTGPKTEAGKARTRLNAKRDGHTGQVITLSDEDRPVFESLKTELIGDLAPETVMEFKLASSIAWDTWRADHLRATEMNMYAMGTEDPETDVECDDPQIHSAMTAARTFTKHADKFALMSLYEQRLNRAIHKNLATLRAMQAERKKAYEKERAEEVLIARSNDIEGLPYQAPTRPTQNGFVFSNDEILAAANREGTLEVARFTVNTAPYPYPYMVQFAGASSKAASATIPDHETADQPTQAPARKPVQSAGDRTPVSSQQYSTKS